MLPAGTGVGGELDAGADGADVGVVEELGFGQGDRRRGDVRVGALRVGDRRFQRRVPAALGRAFQAAASASGRSRVLAAAAWKLLDGVALAPLGAVDVALIDFGSQLVGLRVKPGPVDADRDRADAAAARRRGSVGIGSALIRHLGRFRVDEDRRPDDDGAEVEGTGDRRGDEGEPERRAFIWAGEVGLAGGVEGAGAGAGAGGRRCRPGWPPGRRGWPARRRRYLPIAAAIAASEQ